MCDVCIDDFFDEEKEDDLIICEGCNVAVHSSCYGHDILNKKPDDIPGEWYCQRCIAMQQMENDGEGRDPSRFACILCPDLKGAIVKTNIGTVHITCVNWIPDVWFADQTKTSVGGKLDPKRTQLVC